MYWIFIIFAITSILYSTIKNGISPMPSNKHALTAALEFLHEPKVLYDLGCGFGLSSLFFAKKMPPCKVIGVENALFPFLIAKLLSLFVPNLTIRFKNFLNFKPKDADAIYLYLCPSLMQKIDLTDFKNITVISNTFGFNATNPKHKKRLNDFYKSTLYVYSF